MRELLEKILLGSKYIWNPLPDTLNEEELYGIDDQMGYMDHLTDFIQDLEKKAYKAGFLAGAEELIREDKALTLDIPTNQITAERRYLAWRE